MGKFSAIVDILFPPKCVFCKKKLEKGENSICKQCGNSLPYTTEGGIFYGDFFTVCVAPLYYEDNVRESLLRFKFKGATEYSKVYGQLLASCINENLFGRYDLISWVPLSSKRLKERGYDQSMLLAMATALALDDVAACTLDKVRDVAMHTNNDSIATRKANLEGAYRVVDRELIDGRRILLIDDVVTTGSTFSECANTLLSAGAAEVLCAAVARERNF